MTIWNGDNYDDDDSDDSDDSDDGDDSDDSDGMIPSEDRKLCTKLFSTDDEAC